MGRGRAKAKQTKVARRLKYQTLDPDLTALQRELTVADGYAGIPAGSDDDEDDSGDDDSYDPDTDDEDEAR